MAGMESMALTPKLMGELVSEVYRHTGVTLDESKQTMLVVRLRKRIRELRLASFGAYLAFLRDRQGQKEELGAFIDAVTTHKTSMFRTPRIWQHLWEQTLPAYMGRGERGPLRVWSAASSTGEEAASIAVTCQGFAEKNAGFSWSVLATDVAPGMVEQASRQTFEAARIKPDWALVPWLSPERCFVESGEQLTLSAGLRSRMRFQRHNLFEALRESPFQVVFLRNVIIYFTPEDKLKVIRGCMRVIEPGGLLILGESESIMGELPGLSFLGPGLYQKV